jgi:hypothetical protein
MVHRAPDGPGRMGLRIVVSPRPTGRVRPGGVVGPAPDGAGAAGRRTRPRAVAVDARPDE